MGTSGSMDTREKRLAENEAVFRSVNERIEAAAMSGREDEHATGRLCEHATCAMLREPDGAKDVPCAGWPPLVPRAGFCSRPAVTGISC